MFDMRLASSAASHPGAPGLQQPRDGRDAKEERHMGVGDRPRMRGAGRPGEAAPRTRAAATGWRALANGTVPCCGSPKTLVIQIFLGAW